MEVYEAIRKRKSTRNYTEEEVKREQIEQVLEAGRQAPFAGLAQAGKTDFRHFFVIKRGSETAEKLMDLVLEARKEDPREVEEKHLEEKYPVYAGAVKNGAGKKPMDLFMAPLLIVAAERAGRPAREHAALGYVMENMWLRATELGLGFKLCSGVSDVKDQSAMKRLFGLPEEENYAFEGCSLGYAVSDLYREDTRQLPELDVTYLP